MWGTSPLVLREHSSIPSVIIRRQEEWGLWTADVVAPPWRLSASDGLALPAVSQGVDARRLEGYPTPAQILESLPPNDTWSAQSRRSLAKLVAFFLIGEDPQRRLDAREVSTLAHQVSLVRHVLDNDGLRRVLIADEVGLGKTVEVGLILKELVEKSPQLRVLYLAPARLVSNVRREFDRMKLGFRQWSATEADARLTDNRLIASIHRAVHTSHISSVIATEPWDVIVVDECHHLSDWALGGGDPREKFRLVRDLIQRQGNSGRILLLSGTPHQGHVSRFDNLIGLLKGKGEEVGDLTGRVIYRTKDDVRDWDGHLLFPRRDVKEPIVVDLGAEYKQWISDIHQFYAPKSSDSEGQPSRRRAAGWRCAQALQWAASSPQAGLGYLVRQAIRAGKTLSDSAVRDSVAALRPYRGGSVQEPIAQLFERMRHEVQRQNSDVELDDMESDVDADTDDTAEIGGLLSQGLRILGRSADAKWQIIKEKVLDRCGGEKVVLFAQPIETVTAFAHYLERVVGKRPALIIGGQSDSERQKEVDAFHRPDGPQFLVSSRAGGEGINLQVSRHLVHIDVPWNPMDMEQRVGRVHRFGSRRTIMVETLVVKDSREEHAYRVARDKLQTITSTMVAPERFEQVFSRVMCLVPPEELQSVLANGPVAPLTPGDQEQIARVVREGFSAWQEFDRKFAESQKHIRAQSPGLATWPDVGGFLQSQAKWTVADDFVKQRFDWVDGELESSEEAALVLRSPEGRSFACCDQGGIPVFGKNNESAEQLGLNLPEVRTLLKSAAFPDIPTGFLYVRWPGDRPLPEGVDAERFFVFFFLRQSVRTDAQMGWAEMGSTLFSYTAGIDGDPVLQQGENRRKLFDGLVAATPRVKAPPIAEVLERIRNVEQTLQVQLARPSNQELEDGVRHAVWPVACGVVDFDR